MRRKTGQGGPTRRTTGEQIRAKIGLEKFCSGCCLTLPVENFDWHRRDGYQSKCKSCMKRYQRAYGMRPYVKAKDAEYLRNWHHTKGHYQPLSKARDSGPYLGIYIAERVLSSYFENTQKMPVNNPGYDFICGRGYKIDVKSACRRSIKWKSDHWEFSINRNKSPDYFLCLAFNNRSELQPEHIWLIPGLVVNSQSHFNIFESRLSKWKIYEKPLGKVLASCDGLRGACSA